MLEANYSITQPTVMVITNIYRPYIDKQKGTFNKLKMPIL